MKPSPITARLFELELLVPTDEKLFKEWELANPKLAEEYAFLCGYVTWVAARGPKAYEELRTKERYKQSITNYRLRVQQAKK